MGYLNIQKTYKNDKATIFLLPTPIGNLDDISTNFIKTIKSVDLVFCEDTRKTSLLLKQLHIEKPTKSFHKFNERHRKEELVSLIAAGKNIAICSDAGMPGICDPGIIILNEMLKDHDFNLTIITPGSAFLGSLLISGLADSYFTFLGFLPKKEQQIIKLLEIFLDKETVIVFYDSIHRIEKTVNLLKTYLRDNVKISIVRELTKINEEIIRGTIAEVADYVSAIEYVKKGEICVVVEKNFAFAKSKVVEVDIILQEVADLVKQNYTTKNALAIICEKYKLKKNWLYNMYQVKLQNDKKE